MGVSSTSAVLRSPSWTARRWSVLLIYNVAVGREVAPAQAAGLAQAHARVHAQQYPELDGPVLGPEGLEQAELVLLAEYPRLVPRAVRELKAPVDRRAQPRIVRKLEG